MQHADAFVVTGTFKNITREEITKKIEENGGRLTTAISGRTAYLVTGSKPGNAKLQEAKKYPKIKIIDENQFLQLMKSCTNNNNNNNNNSNNNNNHAPNINNKTNAIKVQEKSTVNITNNKKHVKSSKIDTSCITFYNPNNIPIQSQTQILLWVDKYKPKTSNELVGNRNQLTKLRDYIKSFCHDSVSTKKNERVFFMCGNSGIGKTSAAHLVCEEHKFQVHEFNASDCRSQKEIQKKVLKLVQSAFVFAPPALIFDEIDGIDPVSDHDAVGEIVRIATNYTKIPIICICNDMYSKKLEPLKKISIQVKWYRPTIDEIKQRLIYIIKQESAFSNIKTIDHSHITRLIQTSYQDIRQCINNLQFLSLRPSQNTLITNNFARDEQHNSIFDTTALLFTAFTTKNIDWIDTRSRYMQQDTDLISLMIHENYPNYIQLSTNTQTRLNTMVAVSDDISIGDLIYCRMVSEQEWDEFSSYREIFAGIAPGLRTSKTYNKSVLVPRLNFPRNKRKAVNTQNKNSITSPKTRKRKKPSSSSGENNKLLLSKISTHNNNNYVFTEKNISKNSRLDYEFAFCGSSSSYSFTSYSLHTSK